MNIVMATNGDKLDALRRLAESVADLEGDAAEAGVFQGGTLRLIAQALPGKTVFGFDTFTGMPAQAWCEDEPHHVGDFSDTSLALVRKHVADLSNVVLVPGLFPASAHEHETRRFAFVYLDFDFYRSTRDALAWFMPRMTRGGLIVFDDYEWRQCPGVKRAIHETDLAVFKTATFQVAARVG